MRVPVRGVRDLIRRRDVCSIQRHLRAVWFGDFEGRAGAHLVRPAVGVLVTIGPARRKQSNQWAADVVSDGTGMTR